MGTCIIRVLFAQKREGLWIVRHGPELNIPVTLCYGSPNEMDIRSTVLDQENEFYCYHYLSLLSSLKCRIRKKGLVVFFQGAIADGLGEDEKSS